MVASGLQFNRYLVPENGYHQFGDDRRNVLTHDCCCLRYLISTTREFRLQLLVEVHPWLVTVNVQFIRCAVVANGCYRFAVICSNMLVNGCYRGTVYSLPSLSRRYQFIVSVTMYWQMVLSNCSLWVTLANGRYQLAVIFINLWANGCYYLQCLSCLRVANGCYHFAVMCNNCSWKSLLSIYGLLIPCLSQ